MAMKIVLKLLRLMPVRSLVDYLPDVLAYIISKVLTYMLTRHPEKSKKVIETAMDLTNAITDAVARAKDGEISKEDLSIQRKLWAEVFR